MKGKKRGQKSSVSLLKGEKKRLEGIIMGMQQAILNAELSASSLSQSEKERLEGMILEMKQAVLNAEKANQAKSDFLANMSHELRTPLHAIKNFARMLLKKSSTLMQNLEKVENPEMREYLSAVLHLDPKDWESQSHLWLTRIFENQERQMGLVDDLLDLVKLESGKKEFVFQEGCLLSTMRSVVEAMDPIFKEKSITLTIQSEQEHAVICLDHEQWRSVIKNLLSNAAKFTPAKGTITLLLEEGVMERVPALILQIWDTGPGIPTEDWVAIFEPFVQSAQYNRKMVGTGLGLAICREIVHAHGGTITASNHSDGGALFTILIPKNCYTTGTKEPPSCAS